MNDYTNNYPNNEPAMNPQDEAFNSFIQSAYENRVTNELLERAIANQEKIIKNQAAQEKQHKTLISYGAVVALAALIQMILWALSVFGVVKILT